MDRVVISDPIISSCVSINTHPTLDGQPTNFSNSCFSQACSSANHHSLFLVYSMFYYALVGGAREEGDPRRGIKKKLSSAWGKRRLAKAKEGELYKLGRKWGVWDDFYQGAVIGKLGAKLMKHMNRIVTQQFKTISWWYKACPDLFSSYDGSECMPCPCCGNEVETLRHMFERCNNIRSQAVRLKVEKLGQGLVEELLEQWGIMEELFKVGGVGADGISWGVWGIITGDTKGALVGPFGDKVKKCIELN